MHIFPELLKSLHIFSHIDLIFTKLQKKNLKFAASSKHHSRNCRLVAYLIHSTLFLA